MALVLKIAAGIFLGMLTFLLAIVAFIYLTNVVSDRADKAACRALTPAQAADAVVADVIRPDNRQFARYQLTAQEVLIETRLVRIEDRNASVPFRLAQVPDKAFVAMPRCVNLTEVEYSSD